ncbi:MAG: hypothetical protein ACFCUR_15325 [Rhodomicrobiaceae bacterium]
MTTTTGYDLYDIDLLDEEFFGPPPRFLVEDRPTDFTTEPAQGIGENDGKADAFGKIKSLLGLA